jgi:hypothetical protein
MDKNKIIDKSKIPFYQSKLAQSFIDFELNEYQKNNIQTDLKSIEYDLKCGLSIDDIALCDAVSILVSVDLKKAHQAAEAIRDPSSRESAERSIRCYQERCFP